MDITTEKTGGIIYLALDADSLDASNAGQFKRSAAGAVESGAKVVLDLSQVQFIDSTGIGAILSLLRQLTTVGGDLKLCSASKPVRSLLELTRITRLLEVLHNRDEAAKAYHG